MMIARTLTASLTDLLGRFPAVALLGPRQAGKTTLARSLGEQFRPPALYLDLELPSDCAKLSDPELYLSQHADRLVILDEIHRLPGLFQTLRALIERRRRSGKKVGQFLLLGSASIDLMHQSAETLAGRIAYLELNPFTIDEVAATRFSAMNAVWVRGGFPESFLADDDQASFEWRTAFLRTYLERDVPLFGPRIPAETLRRFWQMLAHSQGQTLNAAQLAAGLGVSGHTVARYLDILVDLLLVRRLQPWAGNVKKRLIKSPKVYVRDSGLVHALLGIRTLDELLGHPIAGPSWEGLLVENIVAGLPHGTRIWFYRTSAGAEVDLVLELGARKVWAIEMKRSISSTTPSKGFYLGSDDIQAMRRIVLYAGNERYKIDAQTEVMSFSQLSEELKKL